jgi:predicted ArsR family transcriptional regulator
MRDIEYYLDKKDSASSRILVLLQKKKNLTREAMSEHLPDLLARAINVAVATLRKHQIIYVSSWKKSKSSRPLAAFSIGDEIDAEFPISCRLEARKLSDAEIESRAIGARYDAINRALVPLRNMKQQRVVNQRYLEHLQGIR